jgi:hypothetical protein
LDLRAQRLGEEQQQVASCIQLCIFVLKTQLMGCFGTACCTDSTPQLRLQILRGSGDELDALGKVLPQCDTDLDLPLRKLAGARIIGKLPEQLHALYIARDCC